MPAVSMSLRKRKRYILHEQRYDTSFVKIGKHRKISGDEPQVEAVLSFGLLEVVNIRRDLLRI